MKFLFGALLLFGVCVRAQVGGGPVNGGAAPTAGSGELNTFYSTKTYTGAVLVGGTLSLNDGIVGPTYFNLASGLFTIGQGTGNTAIAGTLSASSSTFVGVSVSSAARGSAGTAVTAKCPSGTFAIGGGCDCTVEVAETSKQSMPSPNTPSQVPTGWTCQSVGGTGGQCAPYAICSRLQ